MKKINLRIVGSFLAVLVLAAFVGSAFLTSAQQQQTNRNLNNNQQRARQTAPSASPSPAVSPTPPGDDNEPIRVESDNVLLSVRVVDRNGRIFSDVRPEEFKVYEDGVLQPIEGISREDVPVNYGLVVDNSGSLKPQLDKVIEAAKIIINANKPQDASFVIRFIGSEKIEILRDFTSNKQDLIDAVEDMFSEAGQTAIIDAVTLSVDKASEYEKERRLEDKTRRALILVTDGEERGSFYKQEELFRKLREADVQIYPIGFVNDLDKQDGNIIRKSTRDKAVKLLERLAQETGGKAYFPQSLDELPAIANTINNELRTQYLIAYAPTNDKRDGSFRTIRVTVNDDPKRGKRIPVTKNGRTAPKN